MTKERGTGKECMTMITILGGNKRDKFCLFSSVNLDK